MFPYWPGGKNYSDTLNNMIGDTIGAILPSDFTSHILQCASREFGQKGRHIFEMDRRLIILFSICLRSFEKYKGLTK